MKFTNSLFTKQNPPFEESVHQNFIEACEIGIFFISEYFRFLN